MPVSTATSDVLIGIAQHDPSALEGLFQARLDNLEASGLDPKSYALANIAALIALDAPPASYLFQIGFALDAWRHPRGDPRPVGGPQPDGRQRPDRGGRRRGGLRPGHRPRPPRQLRGDPR